jgi:hypothetical protein
MVNRPQIDIRQFEYIREPNRSICIGISETLNIGNKMVHALSESYNELIQLQRQTPDKARWYKPKERKKLDELTEAKIEHKKTVDRITAITANTMYILNDYTKVLEITAQPFSKDEAYQTLVQNILHFSGKMRIENILSDQFKDSHKGFTMNMHIMQDYLYRSLVEYHSN